jgi:hypothetical protein
MNKIIIHSSQVIIALVLGFVVLSYWKNKIFKNYKINLNNLPYGIFMSAQMFAVFAMVYFGTDPQTLMYLEQIEPFGMGAQKFWSFFGVQVLVLFTGLILSYLISSLFFKSIISSENSLLEEIYNEKLSPALIHTILIVSFSILISTYLVHPMLYDWAIGLVGLVPLN